ncbi:hypothetical protein PInf_008558 [Phytophthora infestans]|nr:hypothetical protein PInf_008558 [Phytophthora infestans]
MLFTDQQMADDLLATVPKLHAAISIDPRIWHRKGRKDGVTTYELVPSDNGSDDLDLAYASLAKTEIKCHLNEVLNVLISHESCDYQSTMSALCGDKFRDGRVVFQQPCHLSDESRETRSDIQEGDPDGQKLLISVNAATLQAAAGTTHEAAVKETPTTAAVMLRLVPRSERTALRHQLDHLAVGFDIESTSAPGGSSNQTTSIIAHGYASVTPPEAFGAYAPDPRSRVAAPTRSQVTRRRAVVMNPEAKHVLDLLTRSLKEFERVIRRRRFGFQSFVYLQWAIPSSDCSQLHEVEARVGQVRRNRICVECVVRVDACKFEDENLIAALGPTVVSDDHWFSDGETDSLDDTDTASLESNSSLHDQ